MPTSNFLQSNLYQCLTCMWAVLLQVPTTASLSQSDPRPLLLITPPSTSLPLPPSTSSLRAFTGFLPGSASGSRMLCWNAWERDHPFCPFLREREGRRGQWGGEEEGEEEGWRSERGTDMASKEITASGFVSVSKDITGG